MRTRFNNRACCAHVSPFRGSSSRAPRRRARPCHVTARTTRLTDRVHHCLAFADGEGSSSAAVDRDEYDGEAGWEPPAKRGTSGVGVSAVGGDDDVAGRPSEQFSAEAAEERQELFNEIAPVYDQLNDLLSLGLHRVWKRAAVKWTGVREGDRAIDVCCGSGDIALRLAETVGPSGDVVGLDFAAAQLRVAAEKEAKHPSTYALSPISWVQGDALNLPYPDESFDAATIGYGLRNVADIPKALSELARVLKPGCSAAVVDFNNAEDPNLNALQGFLLDNVVVPVADMNGVAAEYRYLQPSIARYPKGPELVDLAVGAGFNEATFYELAPGNLMGCLVMRK